MGTEIFLTAFRPVERKAFGILDIGSSGIFFWSGVSGHRVDYLLVGLAYFYLRVRSGGVRGGDLPGGELTLVSTKILSTKLKDTTGYGREIST